MSYEPPGAIRLNAMLGLPDPCPIGYIQLTNGKFIFGTNEGGVSDENGIDASGYSAIGPNAKWSFKTMDNIERVLRTNGVVMGEDGTLTDGCEATFLWCQARYNWAMRQGTETWRAKANDYAMMQVTLLTPTSYEIDVALNARGASMTHAAGDRLVSGAGRFVEVMQGDANLVIYDTWYAPVGDPFAAIYASDQGGHIKDHATEKRADWVPAA